MKQPVLNRDLLDVIPTGRQVWTVGYTLPGVTLNGVDVGGAGGKYLRIQPPCPLW